MNAVVEQPRAEVRDLPADAPARPLTVIEAAIRSGASADQLEKLLELQVRHDTHQLELMREKRKMDEEDRARDAKLAFDAALTELRRFNVIIPKTKEVVQTKRDGGAGPRFMQSEFDVVCSMLSPALHACGLSFRHDMQFGAKPWTTDGKVNDTPWVTVTCYLTHKDGHTEKLVLEGPPDTSGAKNPLQEMQSTASYLKRQSLLAITGTATGGEDDENRLRGRGRRTEDDPATPDPLEQLRTTGQEKAMEGSAALTAWWGKLTSRERTELSPDFKHWRNAATKADAQPAGARHE